MYGSTKQAFGISCCLILVLSLTLLFSSFMINPVKAQGSGQFPDSGNLDNAGSVIIYSISGVSLSAPNDHGPRDVFGVWARQFTGTITGGTITVSGTLKENGSGFSAHLAVSVSAGDQTDSASYDRPATTGDALVEWDQSFSVSVTVPQGATTASFSIDMVSSHDAGNRENVVYGDFTAQSSGVDHISISSPYDYVNTGDSQFTVTATVFGPDNSQVPDGTSVTFSLQDKEGGTLGGAKMYPQTQETSNSQVTATFYPPTSSYWDSTHLDYAGTNTITIRASAGGKQGAYEIAIYNSDNSGDLNNPNVTPDITTPTPPAGRANYTLLIVAGVVIAVVVVGVVVVAIKLSAKPKIQSQTLPPPPPAPPGY
jgi:hypothetical protein